MRCCFHGRRTREFTSRCPKDTSDLRHKARYRCLNSVRFCKCTRCDRLPQKDNCGCIFSSLGYWLLSIEIVKMLRSDSSGRDATPHLTWAGLSRSVSPIRRNRSARARSASPIHHGSEGLICERVFRALRRIAKAHEIFRKARISTGKNKSLPCIIAVRSAIVRRDVDAGSEAGLDSFGSGSRRLP